MQKKNINIINVLGLIALIAVNHVYCQTIVPITLINNTSNTSSISIPSQSITIKLQRKPNYAYPGIITDFIITPGIDRTQEQIQNLFTLQFSDSNYLPPRIYFSRGDNNNTQIRALFDYHNDIPFKPFSVKYTVKDNKYIQLKPASITLIYDSASGGISSALFLDQDKADVLR